MNEAHDPGHTVDHPSAPADSLDAGLAAGFAAPRSSLPDMRQLLLKEAQSDSGHVVQPHSDAMPAKEETGDRYQLQGEIARGGMGAVLRGRDVDLGRDLAVKVLLEKHAERPEVVRRFLDEAQVGAQLQHPGVVPVYDIGRFGDRPFFTMKLVKGHTLAALLAERADPAVDRPRLLTIALQVAQTLAYAHAKGVIHRDLKPGNIMVGAFGEVQVMDWGLAKVLPDGGSADEERTSRERQRPEETTIRTARSTGSGVGTDTEAGSLLGTPAYMPPEQANGDVALLDRRADVFGLGAILCEILTGKPPYVGRSSEEVRRKAANGDLADARARLDACGADAELIPLTTACLSSEAIDRPRDAQAVADGLKAYLDGVQDRLHQATLAEAEARARAAEEAKRRRLTLILAATVLLAVTLGGGGWLWLKADRDGRQAQLARDVNDALNRVTALREQAKAAPAGSAALFGQAREQMQRALALVESGPTEATLRDQVQLLQGELDEEEKDRRLLADLEAAWLAQAEFLAGQGSVAQERAVPLFRAAFRGYGLPVGEGEPRVAAARIRQRPAVREALVAALDEWIGLATRSRRRIAEPHLDWLEAVARAAEPDDSWTRRLRAARAEKDRVKRRQALERLAEGADVPALPAPALTRLARALSEVQARDAEVRLLRRARQQYPADFWLNHHLGVALLFAVVPADQAGAGRSPNAWRRAVFDRAATAEDRADAVRFHTAAVALRPNSALACYNLGMTFQVLGRFDEAIASYQKALALSPAFAMAWAKQGSVLHELRRLDEAITCVRQALTLDPKLAGAHNLLGLALYDKGLLEEAIASYRQALALEPRDVLVHTNLGNALKARGKEEQAIACFRQAIALDPEHVAAHNHLGLALAGTGKVDEAIACFRKAIALDPKFAGAHTNLGTALKEKGRLDEAIACCRKALELDPRFALAHNNLGLALAGTGKLDEATTCFRQALALDPKLAPAHHNLGDALEGTGKVEEAIACYRKAIALDPKLAPAHYNLGSALAGKGKLDEAIASFRQVIALDPKLALAHHNLGRALASKGRVDEAITCFRQVIALDPKLAPAHQDLGIALAFKGQLDKAIACLRQAIALGPRLALAHDHLGKALQDRGQVDEAIACHQRAIALDPKLARAHENLGHALKATGQLTQAIASYRKALELGPNLALAHNHLAIALKADGKLDEAIAGYRQAIAITPNDAAFHYNLGIALYEKGQVEEAIACYRRAIALDPTFPRPLTNLGNALANKGRLDEAIACYRQAIALEPKHANAHAALGQALLARGRFVQSRAASARALELLPENHPLRAVVTQRVRTIARLLKLEARLPRLLEGEDQPGSAPEALDLAALCQLKRLHAAAARFAALAFAADPRLADDLGAGHRYQAACSACLAAAGQGEDAARIGAKERLALRRLALTWLRADLARWSRLFAAGEVGRSRLARTLAGWLKRPDLAAVRDKAALDKLPAEERAACEQLWADVAALLKKVETPTAKEPRP
jgi:serine/threonine-protein kinase